MLGIDDYNICGDCVWYVKRKKIDLGEGRRGLIVEETCVVKMCV